MKKMTKRTQQAIATRKKILNTSIALIKERGYNQVKIDDICEACNLTKGAFYHHFKSKLDIISESEAQLNEALEAVYKDSAEENLKERILLFINSMLAEVERSGIEFARQRTIYVVGGEYIKEEDTKSFSVSSRQMMGQMLQDALDHGELKPGTPVVEIREILMTFVSGMIADWCIFNGEYSLSEKAWPLTLNLVESLIFPVYLGQQAGQTQPKNI